LLVNTAFLHNVLDELHGHQGFGVTILTTLRNGLPPVAGAGDVTIVRLARAASWDIFDVTRKVRAAVVGTKAHPFDRRDVSPNHVLIPAKARQPLDSHNCPWGPPEPSGKGAFPAPQTFPRPAN